MIGTLAVVGLLLIAPVSPAPEEERAGVEKDPWIGLHRHDLVAALGQPRKVKRDPQGNEVLTFRFRWSDRLVEPSESRKAVDLDPGSAEARDEGPTLSQIWMGPTRGGFTGKKQKVVFYLDAQGRVTRYEVKTKRSKK